MSEINDYARRQTLQLVSDRSMEYIEVAKALDILIRMHPESLHRYLAVYEVNLIAHYAIYSPLTREELVQVQSHKTNYLTLPKEKPNDASN